MDFSGQIVVVTGGSSGIGAAMVSQFKIAGACVCVFDRSVPSSRRPADLYAECDVSDETALRSALQKTVATLGAIDIFVSNAGVLSDQPDGAASADNTNWEQCWKLNVMAHVFAARALLPSMVARKSGYFVTVASAAGLLNQIGDAAYSATKHAAVSFAESLAITHADDGIGVSVVCPQYVATPLIGLTDEDVAQRDRLLSADDVALSILDAVRSRRFLVLPHEEVAGFAQSRARDHDKWIKGMAALRQRSIERFGDARPERFYQMV